MILHRALIGRALVLAAMVMLLVAVTAGAAGASSEGAELRRIDTSNVNKKTDIHEVVDEKDEDAGHVDDERAVDETDSHEAEADEHDAAADDGHEEEASSRGEEDERHAAAPADEGEHGEEAEVHHPAWMFTGWQSVFTVLAVIYFGLGVTLLPYIMAKEEH